MTKEVKCFFCKNKGNKELMYCEETQKKDKVTRKYFHYDCKAVFEKEKEFKKQELEKWDQLYQFVLKLHNLQVLDGRMIKKLQDLRNGTIKLNGREIKKYKEGVGYEYILETYKKQLKNIDWVIKNKDFDSKWNEFSYVFSMVISKINDTIQELQIKKKHEEIKSAISDVIHNEDDTIYTQKSNKKDELDISEFL